MDIYSPFTMSQKFQWEGGLSNVDSICQLLSHVHQTASCHSSLPNIVLVPKSKSMKREQREVEYNIYCSSANRSVWKSFVIRKSGVIITKVFDAGKRKSEIEWRILVVNQERVIGAEAQSTACNTCCSGVWRCCEELLNGGAKSSSQEIFYDREIINCCAIGDFSTTSHSFCLTNSIFFCLFAPVPLWEKKRVASKG